jgi:hypothetical protein
MNVREYLLQHDPHGEGDTAELADQYVKEVLSLKDADAQHAALVPAIRSMVSTISSSLRRGNRGTAQNRNASQASSGGTAEVPGGGDAQAPSDSPAEHGAAPARDRWLSWMSDNATATLWIPGSGKRPIAEVTPEEFDRRAEWLENAARGMASSARDARECAAALRQAGVTCARELTVKAAA